MGDGFVPYGGPAGDLHPAPRRSARQRRQARRRAKAAGRIRLSTLPDDFF